MSASDVSGSLVYQKRLAIEDDAVAVPHNLMLVVQGQSDNAEPLISSEFPHTICVGSVAHDSATSGSRELGIGPWAWPRGEIRSLLRICFPMSGP